MVRKLDIDGDAQADFASHGGEQRAVFVCQMDAYHYWERFLGPSVADRIANAIVDPTFSFMTVDHDGKIRMDCSSSYAMARLVGLKDQYHVAFGNEMGADRRGIVTPVAGLTKAPGNDARIGGLKVLAESGWFAARLSGTLASISLRREFQEPDTSERDP